MVNSYSGNHKIAIGQFREINTEDEHTVDPAHFPAYEMETFRLEKYDSST